MIELLVVVATISLLLAILLPCLQRAKLTTQRLVCQSNLRQIAQAWQLYLNDHDGRFYQGPYANLEYGGWQGEYQRLMQQDPHPRPLNPYVGLPPVDMNENNAKIFYCPADRGGASDYYPEEKAYRWRGTSYQTNIMLIGQNQIDAIHVPTEAIRDLHVAINHRLENLKLNRISGDSRLLLIGDYGWVNQWKPVNLPPHMKELAEWHQRIDSHNLAFFDGHVKFLTIRKWLYIGDEYTIIPFKDLYSMARTAQTSAL